MTLKAPDGAGIKGGKIDYHSRRVLAGVQFAQDPLWASIALTDDIVFHHARMAARAALNQMYNGRRPRVEDVR